MRNVLLKLFRAGGLALGLAAVAGTAMAGASPQISGLNPYIVVPGQTTLEIDGSGFTQFHNQPCNVGTGPTITFFHLPDGAQSWQYTPDPNSRNCSETALKVPIPANFTDAYQVQVTAYSDSATSVGSPVNTLKNFQITVQPTVGGSSPTSGEVGTNDVTVSGTNLHPPTLPNNPRLRLACGSLSGWSDTSVDFDPLNQSCNQSLAFTVVADSLNPSSSQVPINLGAGSFSFQAPRLDGGSLGGTTVGKLLDLPGSNLGSVAGTVSFAGGVAVRASSWSDGDVQVSVPAGAQSGQVSVNMPNYSSGPAYSNGPLTVNLNPTAASFSPTAGSAGSLVTVAGYNFGTTPGQVAVGGVNQAVKSWSDRNVSFALGGDTDGGELDLVRGDGTSVNAGVLNVVPHLSSIDGGTTLQPGASVIVYGISLGSGGGMVMLGNTRLAPALWSRGSVVFALPNPTPAGHLKLSVINGAGAQSNTLDVTVMPPPPTPTPAPGHQSSSGIPAPVGAAPSPFFDLNHQFHKPPKPPSAIDINVDAEPKTIPAGGSADLTVTLKLKGAALPGAPIQLSMIYSPAADYVFTPSSGVTDQNGVFKASVRISKTPGSNIILAQSTLFSDQDQVIGTGSAPGSASPPSGLTPLLGSITNPNAFGPLLPALGLGALAAALVGAGLFINLRSHRVV